MERSSENGCLEASSWIHPMCRTGEWWIDEKAKNTIAKNLNRGLWQSFHKISWQGTGRVNACLGANIPLVRSIYYSTMSCHVWVNHFISPFVNTFNFQTLMYIVLKFLNHRVQYRACTHITTHVHTHTTLIKD
jgi:hypothetical protein